MTVEFDNMCRPHFTTSHMTGSFIDRNSNHKETISQTLAMTSQSLQSSTSHENSKFQGEYECTIHIDLPIQHNIHYMQPQSKSGIKSICYYWYYS